jgi:dodecin
VDGTPTVDAVAERPSNEEAGMAQESIARVTEISARSPESFEDAIQRGIERATRTLRNVEGAWIKEQEVVIDNDEIVAYEVNMKVTFQLEG